MEKLNMFKATDGKVFAEQAVCEAYEGLLDFEVEVEAFVHYEYDNDRAKAHARNVMLKWHEWNRPAPDPVESGDESAQERAAA